jgi:hypothetical protein
MNNISKNIVKEDQLIIGGFLALSIAIVIAGLNSKAEGLQLFPMFFCSMAIPPLAWNVFVIEYKKRYEDDVKHWSYDLIFSAGIILTCLGLFSALYIKSVWLGGAFLLGFGVCLPSIFYLKKLDESNSTMDDKAE